MSSNELKVLQTRRIKLEQETTSLERKQENLKEDIEILEEKVIIQDLEKSQKEMRRTVLKLKQQANNLESKLEK